MAINKWEEKLTWHFSYSNHAFASIRVIKTSKLLLLTRLNLFFIQMLFCWQKKISVNQWPALIYVELQFGDRSPQWSEQDSHKPPLWNPAFFYSFNNRKSADNVFSTVRDFAKVQRSATLGHVVKEILLKATLTVLWNKLRNRLNI